MVDFDRRLRDDRSDWFHTFVKVLQFLINHCTEDAVDLLLGWKRHIDKVESRLEAFGYFRPSATRWSHCGQKEHVPNLPLTLFLAIVPKAVINPLPKKLQWRLRFGSKPLANQIVKF